MKKSVFEIPISDESYNKKTAENCRKFYDAEKRIVSKLSKISIPNFDSRIRKHELRLCHNFTFLSLFYFRHYKQLKSHM